MTIDAPLVARDRLKLPGREVDLTAQMLRDSEGMPIELRPQVWAVLRELVLNVNRLVTKDALLTRVWPGLVVTDGSITQAISDVRAALGEAGHEIVKTVPRRGYMLVVAGSGASDPLLTLPADEMSHLAPAYRPSIAVLPFGDPNGEPAGQQLARGLAQDLIAELARNVGLRVVSRHSSFEFADGTTPLTEIGRRMRSRHLVDGSVRHEGDALHVMVELIDSEAGDVIWTTRYTAGSRDALFQRDALVERIAGTITSRVNRNRERATRARAPGNLDVYALTLRAISLRREARAESTRAARALLEKALQIDPDFAPALTTLGFVNALDISLRLTGEWDRTRLAEAAAQVERALALDPEDAHAYRALSLVRRLARRAEDDLAAAQQAVRYGPSDAENWQVLARAQLYCGRAEEALRSSEHGLEFDPLPSIWALGAYGAVLWANRRPEESVRVLSRAMVVNPNFLQNMLYRMAALYESGRSTDAYADAAELMARLPHITADELADFISQSAREFRDRITAAARSCGIR